MYDYLAAGFNFGGAIAGCFLVHRGPVPDEALCKVDCCRRSMVKYDPTLPENELQKDYVRSWHKRERQR